MMRTLSGLWILAALVLSCRTVGQNQPAKPASAPPVQSVKKLTEEQRQALWADSVLATLNSREKLAQLFMVAAYSNKDQKHLDELDSLVSNQKIGGLCWFQGGPVRQANMNNYLQSRAKVPLLVSIDGEWGLGMRLDSTISFPRQMTLAAVPDENLIYRMGKEVARQCKRMGIHINFAPVVDLNVNPANPVIGNRSFGEEKQTVLRKAMQYMAGMQDHGIMACAKHFPGHGDTDQDSHAELPTISHNRARLDSVEMFPFREMIKAGVGSIMVAHLQIPAFDTTKNLPTSLSKPVVTDLLKGQLGYTGLAITDALNMEGVAKYLKSPLAEIRAFVAGNDIMLFAREVPKALDSLQKMLDAGMIDPNDLDQRCRKVLMAKAQLGLMRYRPIETKNLTQDLNSPEAKGLREELIAQSITLLRNENTIVPIRPSADEKIASVVLGGKPSVENPFQEMLSRYMNMDHFQMGIETKKGELDTLLKKLAPYSTIIISINGSIRAKGNYGISTDMQAAVKTLAARQNVVVNLFGSPYLLGQAIDLSNTKAIVFAHEQNPTTEGYAAQAIMGGIGCKGKLPVTASTNFVRGNGLVSQPIRLGYGTPFQRGMDAKVLADIEKIVQETIDTKSAPGGQILVARDGMVVYEKAFGTHMYDPKRPTKLTDIYDLASVTKVSATLLAFMKLVDEGKVKVDDRLSNHITRLKSTNKKDITFREMLAHYARLKPWVPFYQKTLTDKKPDLRYYRPMPSDSFPNQVCENMYLRFDYPDSMRASIDDSDLLPTQEYKYSDLAYYYLQEVVEKYTTSKLNTYLDQTFYGPMRLPNLGYLPLDRHPLARIVPTEYDNHFRQKLVHGFVHDQGAAMLGGVGGHAGLFSNARDLAAVMQLYLDQGTYGGQRYLSEATVKEFIKCQYCAKGNRRAIGFDRPANSSEGPTCNCVSFSSFGHTGFTGTMAWADPEQGIVYIFLSNRVYPDAENNKLLKNNIRTRIQQLVYDAVIDRK